MRICKRGHDLDVVGCAANGQCRLCRREVDARWQEDRYHAMTGWEHSQLMLRRRRRKALRRRAERAQRQNQEA